MHQGSVLSPILFVIVLEALSREFRDSLPWEVLYGDDLVIMAETMEELSIKLENWKSGMEAKGLRVNTKKTKVMISHTLMLALFTSLGNILVGSAQKVSEVIQYFVHLVNNGYMHIVVVFVVISLK